MEVVKEEKEVVKAEPTKPVYDPSKNYGWSQETIFELNGQEFGAILNTLRAIVTKPETQELLKLVQSSTVLERVLARGVEAGIVKEKKEEGAN